MKIAIVTIIFSVCLLAFTANVNAKSIEVISKETQLEDNDVISLLKKDDILKENHEKHSHEHKHDLDDQSKSSKESHEKQSHEHKHDVDDQSKSSKESHEKHSHEHKHDTDDQSKSSKESHENHSHEHKHDVDDQSKSSNESHEKHSHEHKHGVDDQSKSSKESHEKHSHEHKHGVDDQSKSSKESHEKHSHEHKHDLNESSSSESSDESESSEESSGDHSESSEESSGHHNESSEESNESKESSTQTPEDSESTQAPEDPQPTQAPEENPESTPAATEAPEETETPKESETTSAPEDAETIIPENREAQVVTIEELRRSVKDLMLLVENMMMSAIDEANAAVEKITNDDMKSYAAHFISMIEENMINIIDKLSESKVIRHHQRHHLPRLSLTPVNDIIEWEADKQPEIQQQSIEDLHKFIKDFMSTVEDLVFSSIDEINKLSETVVVKEIKPFVQKFVSMIEGEMLALVDRVSETKVEFEMPPSHAQEQHYHQHHHHAPTPPKEGEGEKQEEEEEMNSVLIQPRTANTLWWLLKSILKTSSGVNCTMKAVVNVKETTYKMIDNFHACGTEANKPIRALLDSAHQVLRISHEILEINDNVCDNPDYMADFDANTTQKVSSKCAKKLSTKIHTLNKQISITVKLSKKAHMSMCTTTTFEIYRESIVNFPNFIFACAKL